MTKVRDLVETDRSEVSATTEKLTGKPALETVTFLSVFSRIIKYTILLFTVWMCAELCVPQKTRKQMREQIGR